MSQPRLIVALAAVLALAACTPKAASSSAEDIGSDVAAPAAVSASTKSAAASADRPRLVMTSAPADGDAVATIRTARLQAKAEGRVLVVFVGATWCPPCKKMKAEIDSGRLDERLGKTTLLAFDADKDADRLGAAGYAFRFVPFVALPGPDGHPADAAQATGEGKDAWRELLAKLDAWQAAAAR